MLLLLVPGVGMGGSPTSNEPSAILICLIANERHFRMLANDRSAEFKRIANKRAMAFAARFRKPV